MKYLINKLNAKKKKLEINSENNNIRFHIIIIFYLNNSKEAVCLNMSLKK